MPRFFNADLIRASVPLLAIEVVQTAMFNT